MKTKLALLVLLFLSTLTFAQAHSVALTCVASTSTGVTGYNFYRGTVAGQESTTPLNTAPQTSCSYTDSTVLGLGHYFYTAKAFCPTCNPNLSVASNELAVTIPGDAQPNPPTNLQAPTISLQWTPPIPATGYQLTGYQILQASKSDLSDKKVIASIGKNLTTYSAKCPYGTKCYFAVDAINKQGNLQVISPVSNVIAAQ